MPVNTQELHHLKIAILHSRLREGEQKFLKKVRNNVLNDEILIYGLDNELSN